MRPLACWDCGFEFHRGHGCLSVMNVVCCVSRGLCNGLNPLLGECCRLCVCVCVCVIWRNINPLLLQQVPIPVAAQSKMWVCCRSLAGIVGSNPAWGMELFLLWVLCNIRQRSLRLADHSSRAVLPNVISEPQRSGRPLRTVQPWKELTMSK